jgi:hypothetical protein
VRIIVEVPDLPPGRASSYTVATYVQAILRLRALRRDLAYALLDVEHRRNALKNRRQAAILMAEAQALLSELENDDRSGP